MLELFLTPCMRQMNTQIPMASGTPYPAIPLLGSVAANITKTNMKVSMSSTPNACAVETPFEGAVTPNEPIESVGVM